MGVLSFDDPESAEVVGCGSYGAGVSAGEEEASVGVLKGVSTGELVGEAVVLFAPLFTEEEARQDLLMR